MNLLNPNKDTFTLRQTMQRSDFECYHYLNPVPPVVDFHEHEFYEVFFFLSGDVNYIIEGRTYQLRPGDILLTDNRDIHKPDIRPGKPVIVPRSVRSKPRSIFSNVVFPQPDGPITQEILPARNIAEKSSSTRFSPKFLYKPLTLITCSQPPFKH